MDPLQMANLGRHLHNDLAHSALPGAPVVPDDAVRWARTRQAAAGILRRVADVVAPAPLPTGPRLTPGRGNRQLRWDESPCRPSPTASA
jgi:hypothetical protein